MKICPECSIEYDDSAEHCPVDGKPLIQIDAEVQDSDPLVGVMLTARIRIDQRIGVGGMGWVYKGEDTHLGRTVAVKVLKPELRSNAEDVKRFFNEAQVVAKLRHPNTIQVFDFGESLTKHSYIAMEFMTGEPLEDYMKHSELTLPRIIEIMDQVCQSLDEAHGIGIIHRDLKPDNVFIDTVNNRRMVKVIDFGIAKLKGGEKLTQAGMVFGTPAYMSPEQARGEELDTRSDIYSLGVMLWHLLTGTTPFKGDNPMDVAVQHVTAEIPDVQASSRFGKLPQPLVDLVHQMMAKSRDERPQAVGDVRKLLLSVARGMPDLRVDTTSHMGAAIQVRTEQLDSAGVAALISAEATADTLANAAALELDDDDDFLVAKRSKVPLILAALVVIGGAIALVMALTGGSSEASSGDGDSTGEDGSTATNDLETGQDPTGDAAGVATGQAPPLPDNPAGAVQQASLLLRAATTDALLSMQQSTVTIQLTSVPAGADIVRAATGELVGTTPFAMSALRTDGDVALIFRLDGYEDEQASLSLAHSGAHAASLDEIRADRDRDRDRDREEEEEEEEDIGEEDEEEEEEEESTGPRFVPREPVTIPN